MATLLHGDCLKVMATLPDASVDCFVCDLPYGQLIGGGGKERAKRAKLGNKNLFGDCSWDIKIDLEQFWAEVKRLCRNEHTPVLMFCNTKFGYELIKSNEDWFRYDLVLDKGHGVSFLLANKMPMKSHEMLYVFSKAGAYYKRIDEQTDLGTWSGGEGYSRQYAGAKRLAPRSGGADGMRCSLSVIPFGKRNPRKGHPTEKPETLYEWLLLRYCPDGGRV